MRMPPPGRCTCAPSCPPHSRDGRAARSHRPRLVCGGISVRRDDQRRARHGAFALGLRSGAIRSAVRRVRRRSSNCSTRRTCSIPARSLSDDPHLTIRNLRPPPLHGNGAICPGSRLPAGSRRRFDLQLRWKSEELWQAAARCNGCGHCRTQAAPIRMCPVFRNRSDRRGQPAGQGQPDAAIDGGAARSRATGHSRIQAHCQFVLQLQTVPVGMSFERQHPAD